MKINNVHVHWSTHGWLCLIGFFALAFLVFNEGRLVHAEDRIPTYGAEGGSATAAELAAAMDIPANDIISASLGASDPAGAHVFTSPLVGFPTWGSSFAAISSGNAANAPLPNNTGGLSTILGGLNTSQGNDLVQLALTLNVSPGTNYWAVDWKFLSEEFPEYVGTVFNDAFLIETPSSSFIISGISTITAPNNVALDPSGELVTINTTGAVGMTAANAVGTTYDGATTTLTTAAPVPPGATQITVVFSVMDLGDSILDTTVFLDNFRFTEGTPPSFWEETLDNTIHGLIEAKMLTGASFHQILVEISPWLDALSIADILYYCAPLLVVEPTPASEVACTGAVATAIIAKGAVDAGIIVTELLATDPPDPNFTELAVIDDVQPVQAPDDSPINMAWAAYLTAVEEHNAIIEALVTSLERLQGAAIAGEPQFMLLQAQALQQYWDMFLANQAQLDILLENYATEFQAFIVPIHGDITPLLLQIAQFGFDDEWIDLFQDLGLSQEEIQSVSDIASGVPTASDFDTQGVAGLLEWAAAIEGTAIPALSGASPEITTLIDFLENSLVVPPSNQPPTFDVPPMPLAGTEFIVNTGDTVSFLVQASDSDTGDLVGLGVIDLPADAEFTSLAGNPATGMFSWSPTVGQEGVYIVLFTAIDNHGVSAPPVSIVLDVQTVNQPPNADPNGPYEGYEGVSITLDGSGSSDPDENIVQYDWDLDSDGEYDDASGVTTDVTFSENGIYTVGLKVTDDFGESDEDAATVNVENVDPSITADPSSQSVQYSDYIADITITATDVTDDDINVTNTSWWVDGGGLNPGLPADLGLADDGCIVSAGTNTCTWTLSGIANLSVGVYTVRVTVEDDDFGSTDVDITITVQHEDASVTYDELNQVASKVIEPGGDSGLFSLTTYVSETEPDEPVSSSAAGDISLANVSMRLVSVGRGSSVNPVTCSSSATDSGYDGQIAYTCDLNGVPVNTYMVQVVVDGDYYTGSSEDVFTVYDPSLGFATGGGWFYWPETGERTNFGFTMKYNKKATKVQGSLLLIRHLADGTKFRVKSNMLSGLALGEDSILSMGWASFSGKCTYLAPEPEFWDEILGEYVAKGNHEFLVYVEDWNEPGTGNDQVWIEVQDSAGNVVTLSMDRDAFDNAATIEGGNIAVPHQGPE